MAWQLHYTSARRGPTGRAGFQFVAETPGLPDGVRAGVTPYLSYRPPPDAPLSPDDAELAGFPVSLLYDRVDGRPLLLRCRYLGRDYSGRYGNFFAHAVVAEPDELEGLRPAELWHAPHWTPDPAAEAVLDPLDELTPGTALDPDTLAAWLPESGPADPYALLGHLVDAVADVLRRGHGRVVLVADDVDLIARWIAIVSYSLPVGAAARLSFVTYTGDPEGAAQRLVGTTPAIWAAERHHASHARAFDLRGGHLDGEASRFARTVAGCWRDGDFGGLDALGELAPLDDPGQEGAAALLALCRGDVTVTPDEEAAAAELLTRRGSDIPEWVWRDLVPGVPSMGLGLALAVHERARAAGADEVARQCSIRVTDRVVDAMAEAPGLVAVAAAAGVADRAGAPPGPEQVAESAARCARRGAADLREALSDCPVALRDALLDGVLTGLTEAADRERAAALTPADCDLLYEHGDRLRAKPTVASAVLASIGRRTPGRRIAITGELLRLDGADLDSALREVWATPPSAAECAELLDEHGPAMTDHPALAGLPSRTFTRLAFPGGERLAEPATLRLAERVRDLMPDGPSGRDAAVVLAYGTAITAGPPRAARALEEIAPADDATTQLAGEAFVGAARQLSERPPAFRAELLAGLSEAARARLGARWTADLPARARAGRVPLRGADLGRRNDLVEVVLRLKARGAAEPALEAWARAAAGRWLAARQLDARLSRSPRLRAALRDLLAADESAGGT
ncbi:GTPase-associated protein 1-related protein [Actinomadura meridiana]|uniref:GTPase-associated protein 1-related protein n=1 Tax=Actinomadura meridiana TaxID=559626 RepID=A0ABP8CQ23_9ACTN